jgi:hypothetical protein
MISQAGMVADIIDMDRTPSGEVASSGTGARILPAKPRIANAMTGPLWESA